MATLRSFLVLLLFQAAGALLQAVLHLPLPGPVLGMTLLAVWLLLRPNHPQEPLYRTADGLLGWLGLLFVPAGVGVITDLALLRAAWVPVTVALLGSTLLTLMATAGTMVLCTRRAAVRVRA